METKPVQPVLWEPFHKLVRLTARAFYDDIATKGDNLPKTRSDNRGMAVIVLDALTRRQWVREDDFAKELKIHSKQLRRTLRFFEEEKIIMRDHRKETAKGSKVHAAAVAATADNHLHKEGDDKQKQHTLSYCCLDYAQIYDVVRYRIHRMKKMIKDELESKNTIQEYICPNCSKRYNALDAIRLISLEDEYFHCENCNGELVADTDKFANQDLGDGDENARRRRQSNLRTMLENLEVQLKPLNDQIAKVRDLQVPDYGTLQTWEANANANIRRTNPNNDPFRSTQGLVAQGMHLGEPKVIVAFPNGQDEDSNAATSSEPMKVLPPWMIKTGMNLTSEQRGEVKQEPKMDGGSKVELLDDKNSAVNTNEDEADIKAEYLKAYYRAVYAKQQEDDEALRQQQLIEQSSITVNGSSSSRQVGMKSKRDLDDEWEDGAPTENTSTGETTAFKVDLNFPAEATTPINGDEEDDDDDGVDWEEG